MPAERTTSSRRIVETGTGVMIASSEPRHESGPRYLFRLRRQRFASSLLFNSRDKYSAGLA
jgi:hypothetical protein